MATGSYDPVGIWQHGEDDAYATFSERLNKGQTSTSTTIAAVEARVTKSIVAKVRRNAAYTIVNNVAVPFDGELISYPGAWSATTPSRVVLPKLGYWQVLATAGGVGMDSALLRAWIQFKGTELNDSHVELHGTAGKHDPYVRLATIVAVTTITDYVEMATSSEQASKQLRAADARGPYTTLTAMWLGTI